MTQRRSYAPQTSRGWNLSTVRTVRGQGDPSNVERCHNIYFMKMQTILYSMRSLTGPAASIDSLYELESLECDKRPHSSTFSNISDESDSDSSPPAQVKACRR